MFIIYCHTKLDKPSHSSLSVKATEKQVNFNYKYKYGITFILNVMQVGSLKATKCENTHKGTYKISQSSLL